MQNYRKAKKYYKLRQYAKELVYKYADNPIGYKYYIIALLKNYEQNTYSNISIIEISELMNTAKNLLAIDEKYIDWYNKCYSFCVEKIKKYDIDEIQKKNKTTGRY